MRDFECPKCGDKKRMMATEVCHRCIQNHNKITYYNEVSNDESDTGT
jgi:hypothetical protein